MFVYLLYLLLKKIMKLLQRLPSDGGFANKPFGLSFEFDRSNMGLNGECIVCNKDL